MPSTLGDLLKRKKKDGNHDLSDHSASNAHVDDKTKESKGNFFRNLLNKPSHRPNSRASTIHDDQEMLPAKSLSSPTSPTSPTSDTNKPLPPDPQHDEDPKDSLAELNRRIITPIGIADIHKIFSGAPQYFVRSTGFHSGAPHPSVAFPWNMELEIRDLSDHGQIEDVAWGCVTAGQHIIRMTDKITEALKKDVESRKAHFRPRCFERPDMLSMQGLERGTIGFTAALELGAADALHENAAQDSNSLKNERFKFTKTAKHGLRPMEESQVISRLAQIGITYHEDPLWHQKPTVEMYTDLFTQVLFPPTRVTDSNDPYSLQIQIEALVAVLAAPVWIDFSNVEWRIRLGQILWSTLNDDAAQDIVSINGEDFEDSGTPKYWLLLQVMLSCELVVRLDAVTKNAEKDPKLITSEAIVRFEKDVTRPIKWSLLLARLWLENIKVEIPNGEEITEKPVGWLATLANAVSASPKSPDITPVEFIGLHQMRQRSGLVHFARKIGWPEVDNVATKLAQNMPLETPNTSSTVAVETRPSTKNPKPSHLGGFLRPSLQRGPSKQSLSATIHPSGWLSRSYLTGLVLPGEGLSHFLISTLLENDDKAISQLGDEVNLYGGFVFSGKSFWSTTCIVGRVLAAGKGASECIGWLSSDVLPKGVKNGWVNIEIDLPRDSEEHDGYHKSRIWHKHAVESDSKVWGDGDVTSVLPGDFTLPAPDIEDPVNLDVTLISLDLFAGTESAPPTPMDEKLVTQAGTTETREIGTYSAMMRFTVEEIGGDTKEMDFALTYDVHFVTAHPCVPSPNWSLLNSPTSPLFEVPRPPRRDDRRPSGPHLLYAGHALHKSYKYTRLSISSLLLTSAPSSESLLASLHTSSSEIFVIDCSEMRPPESETMDDHPIANAYVSRKRRFGSSLEMLARAWCAERGYNALISRKGRNCIACSIREARALGWKIVLRFG